MTVKIIILRRYSDEQKIRLESVFSELFSLVFEFGGFVSGETLMNREDPHEHLIISTWDSVEQWQTYHEAERVKELCGMIDATIGKQTTHQVFVTEHPSKKV